MSASPPISAKLRRLSRLALTICRQPNFTVFALFGIYLLVGLSTFQDYGISWDEGISRTGGLVNFKYVLAHFAPSIHPGLLHNVKWLAKYPDQDYGVAFELPVTALEYLTGVSGPDIWYLRHLATFLFAAIGVWAVYKTAQIAYGSYRLGLLAALMIMLSPRIFAESFYNSKDIVFMAAFAVAILTLTQFLLHPGWRWGVAHGFATAYAIDIRVMALAIVAVTIGAAVVDGVLTKNKRRNVAQGLTGFLLMAGAATVAMFPFLWSNPLKNFFYVFGQMAHFRWGGTVFYMGRSISASDLPWHYIPVWILITVPIVVIVLFALGMGSICLGLLRRRCRPWTNPTEMLDCVYLSLAICPILAVIALHSVLYDGWRQMYFVFPALVLVAVRGFDALSHLTSQHAVKIALSAAVVGCLAGNIPFMISAHPLQNVYFNQFAGKHPSQRFEYDYSGLANRSALEYIVRHQPHGTISIGRLSQANLQVATLMLPDADRKRIVLTEVGTKPEYLFNNFRRPAICPTCDLSDYRPYWKRKVGSDAVAVVLKLKHK